MNNPVLAASFDSPRNVTRLPFFRERAKVRGLDHHIGSQSFGICLVNTALRGT
jgi:hypothetical protein